MKIIGVHSRVSPFLMAVLLVLQLSPTVATGQPSAQQATIHGSRIPGIPVPSTDTTRDKRRGTVEITFTKWITTFPLMEGFWGDDLANKFVGEIFQRQVSQTQADNCYLPAPNCGRIIRLEALYEVQNGDRSFTALIRGGTSGDTGAALLDGTILFGWRVGAPVHVEFQTIPGATGCVGAPLGATCFQGTIHIGRALRD